MKPILSLSLMIVILTAVAILPQGAQSQTILNGLFANWHSYRAGGILSQELRQHEEALKKYQESNKDTPEQERPAPPEMNPVVLNKALKHLIEGLSDNSESIQLNMNFSLLLAIKKMYLQAIRPLDWILDAEPGTEVEHVARFNRGVLYGALVQSKEHADGREVTQKEKDTWIELALIDYQRALDTTSDQEQIKRIRTNIELLLQSGGGGGGGGNDQNQQQQQDQEGDKDPKQNPQNGKPQEKKKLSERDVRQLMQEIKDHEQKIRAREQELNGDSKQSRESNEKDW